MAFKPNVMMTNKIDINKGVKSVVFGPSGIGKTRLAVTAEKPFIISSENGLLSLRKESIPYVEVKTAKDVRDIHQWIMTSAEAKHIWTIIVDSGSDLAEVTLSDLKKSKPDPRQAYGEMQDTIDNMFRDFRDMYGKHVVIIAKQHEVEIKEGFTTYKKAYPVMPSEKTQNGLPYQFDLVLHMYKFQHTDGVVYEAFHCAEGPQWFAKDRSGNLAPIEPANIGQVFRKAMSK